MPQAQQVIVCDQACTITLQHEITTPLLDLDLAAGAAIAGAVLAVWAVGFAFRALIQVLKTNDGSTNESE